MPELGELIAFVDDTSALASEVNQNFTDIREWAIESAVSRDVPATITEVMTFEEAPALRAGHRTHRVTGVVAPTGVVTTVLDLGAVLPLATGNSDNGNLVHVSAADAGGALVVGYAVLQYCAGAWRITSQVGTALTFSLNGANSRSLEVTQTSGATRTIQLVLSFVRMSD